MTKCKIRVSPNKTSYTPTRDLCFYIYIYIYIYIDAQKIYRLNAPGFNGLVVAWKA